MALPPNLATNDIISETWVDAVVDSLTALQVTPWTAPSLLNGWVNNGGVYQVARYRKVGDIVFLEGLIKTGAIGAVALTLPAGFRPLADIYLPAVSNTAFGALLLQSNGNVTPAAGVSTWIALNCHFSTVA